MDIVHEDSDVQLDSSLDDTEDLVNIQLSPKREFGNDCVSKGRVVSSCGEIGRAFPQAECKKKGVGFKSSRYIGLVCMIYCTTL